MIPTFVIRPEPGCRATVAAARAAGLDAHGYPLFAVRPLPWGAPDPAAFDALLIGSANALRHGGEALETLRGKPAYAVGEKTAEAARQAGFEVVATGEGGLQELLGRIDPAHHRLLRLAGQDHVALDPPPGITLTERIVYASEPQPMPAQLAQHLGAPALVLLHSAKAADYLAKLCDKHALARKNIAIAALAPRIADAAGTGWHRLELAERPEDAALLALAREMCDDGAWSTS